ncbi:NAD-dependent deacylase [Oceaniglobus trochenteri]|uniref:NAD-dependent deacylase n=1 Tax=Oceaniglobus trochenteri TaxID=2763260 RepID=UPI001CFFFE9E|nr:NAD-dependent deacylase [Oceaniglobus trochenteri]
MIVILTGAGLSAESGLGTFSDSGGLWSRFDLNEVATPQGFARDPAQVHDFYNLRRDTCRKASPNAAHRALARLKQALGDDLILVTQNVDDLLERAGAQQVIHMHGSLMGALCNKCDSRWPAPHRMRPDDLCPDCGARATRPDVVWFGEMPRAMEPVTHAIARADLFVAIGTSGTVYPAAGFVDLALEAGAKTLELNLEPSQTHDRFYRSLSGLATQTVPAFVEGLLTSRDHRI